MYGFVAVSNSVDLYFSTFHKNFIDNPIVMTLQKDVATSRDSEMENLPEQDAERMIVLRA